MTFLDSSEHSMTQNIHRIRTGIFPPDPARTLLYFPIIHNLADMGDLQEDIRRATILKLGEKGWKNKVYIVEKMWTKIQQFVDNLALSYEKVRLYQDGLPVCGRETEIVKKLAQAGSRNHQILLILMERGAKIMGTESAELLVEEYDLAKQTLATGNAPKAVRLESREKALGEILLSKRDQFIGDRINRTLGEKETGILFLGMLHSLKNILDPDICVIYPVHQPVNS
jgi:hypothetical protein